MAKDNDDDRMPGEGILPVYVYGFSVSIDPECVRIVMGDNPRKGNDTVDWTAAVIMPTSRARALHKLLGNMLEKLDKGLKEAREQAH